MLQSPPTRTEIYSVLTDVATAISALSIGKSKFRFGPIGTILLGFSSGKPA
ncbi:hypothetical protein [Chamaesiphon sp. OTE_20_metabat_361]|uniref:hypothetical protein n=1 Tax=Chamaesiphon sp. OTE_20_metabat_361 TaxID=2964689 RepID=UPI00286BC0C9|nr:hypothetical protein [Chamaesiphon sp. OTE_20_metabat_361]